MMQQAYEADTYSGIRYFAEGLLRDIPTKRFLAWGTSGLAALVVWGAGGSRWQGVIDEINRLRDEQQRWYRVR